MRKNTLLRIVALCIAVLMVFTSCAPADTSCTMHFDINEDGICDFCDAEVPITPPADDDNTNPPTGGDDTDPPAGGDDTDPPTADDDNTDPPTGGDDTDPPAGGDDTDPPTGGDDTDPPTGGDDTDPPTGGDDTDPPTGGDDTDPPIGGDDTDPPTGGDDTDPPAGGSGSGDDNPPPADSPEAPALTYQQPPVPEYSGTLQIALNGGVPSFTQQQLANVGSYEYYSERDALGRCGITVAFIGVDIMPTDGRGSTGSFAPTGWQPNFYERCHLIGWQLTGENSNKDNLITGTDDLNAAMLILENQVATYLKANPSNHVLYRVTPIFDGDNLLAKGVHMEAYSIEDNGAGVCFNYFLYNVEEYYDIDYTDGSYQMSDEAEVLFSNFAINKNTGKVHVAGSNPCTYVAKTKPENLVFSTASSWAELIEHWSELGVGAGASACATCDPDTKVFAKSARRLVMLPVALCVSKEEY